MGIRFACHHCGRRLNIKNDLAGKRGVCPQCQGKFRIPTDDADVSLAVDGRHGDAAEPPPQPPLEPGEILTSALLRDDPEAAWYVRPDSGGQFGPAAPSTLAEWMKQGRVATTSLVWRDGWAQWRTAGEAFPELAEQLPGGQAEPGSDQTAAEGDDENRLASISDEPATPTHQPIRTRSISKKPIADIDLAGSPDIGLLRHKRNQKRGVSIGLLAGICAALIVVLIVIVAW